jgi:hypothetical protein
MLQKNAHFSAPATQLTALFYNLFIIYIPIVEIPFPVFPMDFRIISVFLRVPIPAFFRVRIFSFLIFCALRALCVASSLSSSLTPNQTHRILFCP